MRTNTDKDDYVNKLSVWTQLQEISLGVSRVGSTICPSPLPVDGLQTVNAEDVISFPLAQWSPVVMGVRFRGIDKTSIDYIYKVLIPEKAMLAVSGKLSALDQSGKV